MKTSLENCILSLNFTETKALVDGLSNDEFEAYILLLCKKSESTIYYTFDLDLLKSSETACLHYITSIILSHPLCHLKGAYQAAFYHAIKAIEMISSYGSLK